MPYKAKLVTRSETVSSVSTDNFAKGSELSFAEADSNFLNLRDQTIGIASDDSTTIEIGAGNTLVVKGAWSVTTAVAGQTLTITGSTSVYGGTLGNLQVNDTELSPINTNSDLKLIANGTGSILLNNYGKVIDSIYYSIQSINRNVVEYTNSNPDQDQFTVIRAYGNSSYANRNEIRLDSCSGNIGLYTTNASDTVNLYTPSATGSSNNGLSIKLGMETRGHLRIDRDDSIKLVPYNGKISLGAVATNTDSKITTENTNANIIIETQGTGTLDINIPTTTAVGTAGSASALPANPVGYLKIKVNGTAYQIPYYNV